MRDTQYDGNNFGVMKPILSAIYSWLSFRLRSRASLELELIALRHQLSVVRRDRHRRLPKRPWFSDSDRMFWAWLYKLWPHTAKYMQLFRPESVIQWHYRGFCFYWRIKRKNCGGHNKLDPKIQNLIFEMSTANPLWGGKRIRGELRKLGIEVSKRTVRKYMVKGGRWPNPGWRVFIRNNMQETVAMDMFIVVSLTYRLLYGIVVLSHDRRKILHINSTQSPTDRWLSSQMKIAFSTSPVPRYIVRDRDALYGRAFRNTLNEIGIKQALTAPHAWQNNYVERVIGTIRRECLNHVVVRNERHLTALLLSFQEYYNRSRTHFSLDMDCPDHRPVEPPSNGKHIVAIPKIGGLHHRYTRRRAA